MVGVLTKGENIRKRFTAPVPYEMVIMLSIVDVFYVICVFVQIFGVSYYFLEFIANEYKNWFFVNNVFLNRK